MRNQGPHTEPPHARYRLCTGLCQRDFIISCGIANDEVAEIVRVQRQGINSYILRGSVESSLEAMTKVQEASDESFQKWASHGR